LRNYFLRKIYKEIRKMMLKKITVTDLLIGDKTGVTGYHAQEHRPARLEQALKCCDTDAWLGVGFYFWLEVIFAHYWGQDKKSDGQYKSYDIYTADLNIEKCLNTVFNEKHYLFFKRAIEVAIQHFKNNEVPLTLEGVNRFLADEMWKKYGIEGVIYDDKPTNPRNKDRVYSEIPDLYYSKRIQIVLFNLENIRNFELYLKKLKINRYA
jgi:hypothetical protein